ncbi:putative MFS-type transporter EfpA [Baekduia alba]|uniref:MFS transporter n=1 Tax=Baekduia alba TaxID=2997333 RepID=UPI0023426CEF|nr:MFS transporter [Baekduia alba]WCB94996.1 putative MFS-type transporter EfpA [Baekduia alba]
MSSPDAVAAARNKTLILVLCCLAQFMVILDVSIVNVALPSIRGDLGFSATGLQWVVNAYTLAFAGFLLLGGRAADLLGRREVFAGGLLLFAFASLLGGIAQSSGTLIAARAAQGLGGAVVAPATLSILATTFTEGRERNRALGLWGAMGGVGGATGALLGGILTQTLSWRWILLINVPIGIIAALAALHVVARGRRDAEARKSFDLMGALTVTAGLVVLTYGIVETDTHGWGSSRTLVTIALGLALLATFTLIEGRLAKHPLVPLRIFKSRPVSGANVVVFCMGASAFAMWYFLSLYLQQVLGFDPIEAGLSFLPMTLTIVACSQLASRGVGRFGPGLVLTFGMVLIAFGMLGLSQISADGTYWVDVLVPSVVTAAGIGFSFVPVTISATQGVKGPEAGLASGLVNTSRQVGGSIGLALLATVATQRTNDVIGAMGPKVALTDGFQRAFVVGAGFALVGAIVSGTVLARSGRDAALAAAEAERA